MLCSRFGGSIYFDEETHKQTMPHFSTLFCSKPGAPKAHRFQADSPNYAEHVPFGATYYEIS